MKSKERNFLVFVLVIIGFLLTIPNAQGIQRERTFSNVADRDTYLDTASPMSNYGGVNNLIAGFSYTPNIREAYFHFNFSNKPSNLKRAEISLEFWGVSQTMNFTVCIIEDNWDEYTMTWGERPNKNNTIGHLLVASSGIYKLGITSLIQGRTDISICVYIEIDNLIRDYAYITSREGFYSSEDAPQILWTYMETAEITISNPDSSVTWSEGNTYTIRWSSQGLIDRVIIQLYKGVLIEEITFLYTDNDGSYEFYCAGYMDYEADSNYRIKITDYDDSRVYGYSEYFSINVIDFPSLDNSLFIIGSIVGIIGFTAIVIVLFSRRKRRLPKIIPQPALSGSPQPVQMKTTPNTKTVKFCIQCGHQNQKTSKFCENCGSQMVT
jgi:hypothetical protein